MSADKYAVLLGLLKDVDDTVTDLRKRQFDAGQEDRLHLDRMILACRALADALEAVSLNVWRRSKDGR